MIYLFRLMIVLLCVSLQLAQAQTINDVIKIKGQYYVLTPSPSQFYSQGNRSQTNVNVIYRGEYELKNDKLFLVKVLSVSDSIKKTDLPFLEFPVAGQHIRSNERYLLSTIDDIEKVHKILKHRSVEYYKWGAQNTSSLEFVAGKIKRTFYLADSSEKYSEYGMLEYFRYSADRDTVDVVRLKDSLVVKTFVYSDTYDTQELARYEGRYRAIHYAHNNHKQYCELPAGRYRLRRTYDSLVEYSDTCEVVLGSRTEINFKISNPKPIQLKYDTLLLKELSYKGSGFDFEYGNNQIGNPNQHEVNMFSFGWYKTKEKFLGVRNQASIIGAMGGKYAYGLIHPDSNVVGLVDFKTQNYSYLSLLLKGSTRFYLTKYEQKDQTRLFLEVGAAYNLPIIFRYIARNKGDKYSSKWIHQISDVSAFGKIGFHKGMSVMASYRPFGVLKSPYPALPQFTIGFSYSVYL